MSKFTMLHRFSLKNLGKRSPQWFAAVAGSLLALQIVPTISPRNEHLLASLSDGIVQRSQIRSTRVEESDSGYRTAVGWGITALGIGVVGLAWKASRNSQPWNEAKLSHVPAHGSRFSPSNTIARFDQANRKLQRRLLSLLHEDRQAANRLVSQAALKYPERSIDWCVEKVIYDLQRDRH